MADRDLEIEETFSPSSVEIDFLTEKINEESRAQNITSDAYPFGLFVRLKRNSKDDRGTTGTESKEQHNAIVGGCNGSIVYGSIYTDQLWLDPQYRGKGVGRLLMEKVHELGRRKKCAFATVGTMDFQNAQTFYERLGYKVEFERGGYDNGGKMIYLKKDL